MLQLNILHVYILISVIKPLYKRHRLSFASYRINLSGHRTESLSFGKMHRTGSCCLIGPNHRYSTIMRNTAIIIQLEDTIFHIQTTNILAHPAHDHWFSFNQYLSQELAFFNPDHVTVQFVYVCDAVRCIPPVIIDDI